jgi:hypothetical protein
MLVFRARQELEKDGMCIYIAEKSSDGSTYYAEPISFKKSELQSYPVQPTLTLTNWDKDTFINLMNELWRIGVRPTDYTTNDRLSAINYHLEDMRKIVFSKLNIGIK